MIRRHWTVQTLEKRITEGESLLEEFAHSPEWLDLVRRELAERALRQRPAFEKRQMKMRAGIVERVIPVGPAQDDHVIVFQRNGREPPVATLRRIFTFVP